MKQQIYRKSRRIKCKAAVFAGKNPPEIKKSTVAMQIIGGKTAGYCPYVYTY